MDAHLFRRLAQALTPILTGARIAKIQEPAEGLFTFNLDLFARSSALGRKVQLVLSPGRRQPFLFLSTARLAAAQTPSAMVMRLRKYAAGRSIRHVLTRWQERELCLLMSGAMPTELVQGRPARETEDGRQPEDDTRLVWLVLSLREGPRLDFLPLTETPQESEVAWPEPAALEGAMADWRQWPVLTPALRRTLQALSFEDAAALLVDLQEGGGDIFCYTDPARSTGGRSPMVQISAWPLPEALRAGLDEEVREDCVAACMDAGADLVLSAAAQRQARQAAEPWKRRERKLEELLKLHGEDVARLERMCARRDQGLLLQANLWQLQANLRLPEVEVLDSDGEIRTLRLDARYTVRENMERFFHTARRGERGLGRVRERKAELERELAEVRQQKEACLLGGSTPVRKAARKTDTSIMPSNLPRTVQLFVSSDGFVLLRGRNARGNQDARRMASPHDIWVHAEGGPGSHVIIRRSHAAETVPDRTLDEAGSLAACRSWLREEPQGRLTYCELRHVRPLRGAAPGTMRMDKILFTRQVPIDPDLETRLAPKPADGDDEA